MVLARRGGRRQTIRHSALEQEEIVEFIVSGSPRVRTGRKIHGIARDQVGFGDEWKLEIRSRRRITSMVVRNGDVRGG